jgi:hypothetical protein
VKQDFGNASILILLKLHRKRWSQAIFDFPPLKRRKIQAEFSGVDTTSDGSIKSLISTTGATLRLTLFSIKSGGAWVLPAVNRNILPSAGYRLS